jgi:hypothetical protein
MATEILTLEALVDRVDLVRVLLFGRAGERVFDVVGDAVPERIPVVRAPEPGRFEVLVGEGGGRGEPGDEGVDPQAATLAEPFAVEAGRAGVVGTP